MRHVLTALCLVALLAATAQAQAKRKRGYPPQMKGARAEVYKTAGDVELKVWIFTPPGHKPEDKRPAIVFFFGGGWRSGTPAQFEPHCKYLASRGMVAMAADYRVSSRHGVKAKECVADAKSAVRWIRANAKRLGVNPERIAAGGGSAGGHIAACTGTIDRFDEEGEDPNVSFRPDAMVLFNPAVVLAPIDGKYEMTEARQQNLKERMGTDPENLSPYHHVDKDVPPTIIFHGKDDKTVAYKTVELFTEAMMKAGNRCELAGYEGQGHGFFNAGRGDGSHYIATVRRMDEFLISLGWLQGQPAIGAPKPDSR